jgi:hypothetical protein
VTPDQALDVLQAAAHYDQRTIGREDVLAWQLALGDLDREAAVAAVVGHYRQESRRVMPADVLRLAREQAADTARRNLERVTVEQLEANGYDPERPETYPAALRAATRAPAPKGLT